MLKLKQIPVSSDPHCLKQEFALICVSSDIVFLKVSESGKTSGQIEKRHNALERDWLLCI